MNCVDCHRPFWWEGPSPSGRTQGWYRHHEQGPKGPRCSDRNACTNAAAALTPALFDNA